MRGRGFTLSEVLMASTILSIAVAGLLMVFLKTILLNQSSRELSTATSHVQFALEEIRNLDFANVTSQTWNNATIASTGMTPLTNETIVIAVSGTDVLNINSTVNWFDTGSRRDRSISIETIIVE
ncbi:MAG: prepilin-type N-terminal cleavage/methylation domain-containing protein [Candidatus Omnitrophica bacterium]|nr:prepilin-type N-terminal cleavage/methylation domain-containing protein [Candidatus Omnitrophota bacterium]